MFAVTVCWIQCVTKGFVSLCKLWLQTIGVLILCHTLIWITIGKIGLHEGKTLFISFFPSALLLWVLVYFIFSLFVLLSLFGSPWQHGCVGTLMLPLSFFWFVVFAWMHSLFSHTYIFFFKVPLGYFCRFQSLPSRFGSLLFRPSTRSDSSFHHTPSLFLNHKPLKNKVHVLVPSGFPPCHIPVLPLI